MRLHLLEINKVVSEDVVFSSDRVTQNGIAPFLSAQCERAKLGKEDPAFWSSAQPIFEARLRHVYIDMGECSQVI